MPELHNNLPPIHPLACSSDRMKASPIVFWYEFCIYHEFVMSISLLGMTCCLSSQAVSLTSLRSSQWGWRMVRTSWRPTSPSSTATRTARARPACPPCSPATGVSMVSNEVTKTSSSKETWRCFKQIWCFLRVWPGIYYACSTFIKRKEMLSNP